MVLKFTDKQKKSFKFAVVRGDDTLLKLTRKLSIAKKARRERQERTNRVAKLRGVIPKKVTIVELENKIRKKKGSNGIKSLVERELRI